MNLHTSRISKLMSVFPPPRFLEMPAAGIDISDHSIKFIEFVRTSKGIRLGRHGTKDLPPGIVVSGVISKPEGLSGALTELRKEYNLHFVRVSLPEERAYLFEIEVPRASDDEIRSSLEFQIEENVPLKPEEAVFDYDPLLSDEKNSELVRVVVSVFPRIGVEKYTSLLQSSGLVPLSLEIEAQAVARAVVPNRDGGTYMIVDFGRDRSGISVVSEGAVRFATTVGVGGSGLTAILKKHYSDASPEEIDIIKNEQGLTGHKDKEGLVRAMTNTLSALREEINKHFIYWHTHRRQGAPVQSIEKVLLCGGNANLAGLPEYLSAELKVDVEHANVWVNIFSLGNFIPEINFNKSLGYAPAIGLALHGFEDSVYSRAQKT